MWRKRRCALQRRIQMHFCCTNIELCAGMYAGHWKVSRFVRILRIYRETGVISPQMDSIDLVCVGSLGIEMYSSSFAMKFSCRVKYNHVYVSLRCGSDDFMLLL